MQAFVTVGSTKFDSLIHHVLSESVLTVLRLKGYVKLVIQCGDSHLNPDLNPPSDFDSCGVNVKLWKFKPSLQEEYTKADLVISHAGSGTILDVLRVGKRLIVVPNATLLDNHQQELADALSGLGHLVSSNIDNLSENIEKLDETKVVPFPQFDGGRFARILDEEMGFL